MKSFLLPSLLLVQVVACNQLCAKEIDGNGWTILNPAQAEKVVYVSASNGNDNTGVVYSLPSNMVGKNPLLPTGTIKPFRSIAAATGFVKDGEAAWILLKRGDTFYESLPKVQGKSAQAPAVFSYYGSNGKQPLLKTGSSAGIKLCCKDFANLWVVGLSFYAHTRNPKDSDYAGPKGENGFDMLAVEGYTLQNILIEGCTFSYYTSNAVHGAGEVTNVRLRRNSIFDNYSVTGHSQGLYGANLNNLVLEGNVFDHNGWYKQSTSSSGNPKADGQATMFNHNTYFANVQNVRFEENAFYRPSSIGTKWTANLGSASASGVTIANNLYHDCEIAISAGGNKTEEAYRFENIVVENNVISSPGLSAPTRRVLGWGVEIEDWSSGEARNNLIIHQNHERVQNGRGFIIRGENRNVIIRDNLLYDLSNTVGFTFEKTTNVNVAVARNVINVSGKNKYLVELDRSLPDYPFSRNAYVANNPQGQFKIGKQVITLQAWMSTTRETGVTTSLPDYPNPQRSVEQYVTGVLLLPDMDTFYQELRNQTKLNWRKAYTAATINAWIREGFSTGATPNNGTPISLPDPVGAPLYIRAKSSQGTEQMSLWIDGEKVQSWTVATAPDNYTYQGYTGGAVKVSFDNDGGSGSTDRNLAINYILVCGTKYESNAAGVVRTGCGVDNDAGFAWLWCQGSFDFGDLNCTTNARQVSELPTTTVSGLSRDNSFVLYPNPVSEQLILQGTGTYQVKMYDLSGQLVMSHQYLNGKAQLDIRHLRPGVYVVEVNTADSQQQPLPQRIIVE